MIAILIATLAENGGVKVAAAHVIKLVWIQVSSLVQSIIAAVVIVLPVIGWIEGATDVSHPHKKMSPVKGRRNNNFFMGWERRVKYYKYSEIF